LNLAQSLSSLADDAQSRICLGLLVLCWQRAQMAKFPGASSRQFERREAAVGTERAGHTSSGARIGSWMARLRC